jgi:hypothetical protein
MSRSLRLLLGGRRLSLSTLPEIDVVAFGQRKGIVHKMQASVGESKMCNDRIRRQRGGIDDRKKKR